MQPKYPHIHVQLTGHDGNAFAVIGRCLEAARNAGLSQAERNAFKAEAMAGDYDNLLQTCLKWFEID